MLIVASSSSPPARPAGAAPRGLAPPSGRVRDLAAAALWLGACGGGGGDADLVDAAPLPGGLCLEQRDGLTADGDPVVVCERLFDPRPGVRLPDDAPTGAAAVLHLGLTSTGLFVDRAGALYQPVDAAGTALPYEALPASLRAPSNRNMFLLYRVVGELGDPPADGAPRPLRVDAAAPLLLVPGPVLDGAYAAWEGTVSARVDAETWDDADRVPVRVSITATAPLGLIEEWEPTPALADGERLELTGAFDNRAVAVVGADGGCVPALASLGARDPLAGLPTETLTMWRVGGMHGPGDQELAAEMPAGSGMGGLAPGALHPMALAMPAPPPEWAGIRLYLHGTPNGFTLELAPVTGGGGPCP